MGEGREISQTISNIYFKMGKGKTWRAGGRFQLERLTVWIPSPEISIFTINFYKLHLIDENKE